MFGQDNKKIIVHVNQLKKCHNQGLWEHRQNQNVYKKPPKQETKQSNSSESEEEEITVGPLQ